MATDEQIADWLAEEAEPFTGWSFASLQGRMVETLLPWSYEAMVRELAIGATAVLDLGTGGGERLLSFADVLPDKTVATENHPPSVRLARERLSPQGIEVIAMPTGEEAVYPFDENEFDLILNRHSPFNIDEVERVLAANGRFLTQQIDGNSLTTLISLFGTAPKWPHFTLDFVLQLLAPTKLMLVQAEEFTTQVEFFDVGALVYYLKTIPWLIDDFSVQTHLNTLTELQAQLDAGQKLIFETKYMLIQARK